MLTTLVVCAGAHAVGRCTLLYHHVFCHCIALLLQDSTTSAVCKSVLRKRI